MPKKSKNNLSVTFVKIADNDHGCAEKSEFKGPLFNKLFCIAEFIPLFWWGANFDFAPVPRRVGWTSSHAGSRSTFPMSSMYVLPEYYVLFCIRGGHRTLHCWQWKANPISNDIYPDSQCWVPNLSGAREVHILQMGEWYWPLSISAEIDVDLRHLSQSRILQENY